MLMKSYRFAALAAAVLALSACGGGGGGGETPSTPSTPSTPAPSVPLPSTPAPTASISLSKSKSAIGESVTVNWSSTNATSCNGADAFSGQLNSTGSQTVTPSKGGKFTYTVTCTGAGGSVTQSATLVVPMPVLATSYMNAKDTGIGAQDMPYSTSFRSKEAVTAGHQFADFFQEGEYSMLAASNVFDAVGEYGSTTVGKIFFFKKVGTSWVDKTSDLLSDQTGCISPRKVVVADFNGDKKPDAFIACHGIDGKVPPGQEEGETSRFIMSQPDGRYTNTATNFKCYCHGASAADFSGAGYADLVITDTVHDRLPTLLINNRNGTFSKDNSGLSLETVAVINNIARLIYTVEFVDVDGDGILDLFVAGAENDGKTQQLSDAWFPPTVYKGTGNRTFKTKLGTIAANSEYSVVLDIVVKSGKIAVLRTNSDYTKMGVQVINSTTFNTTSFTPVTYKDTLWMTLLNGNIIGAFNSNPYTITW